MTLELPLGPCGTSGCSDRLAMRNLTNQNLGLRDFKSRLRDLQALEGDEAVEKTAFSVLESGHAPGPNGPSEQWPLKTMSLLLSLRLSLVFYDDKKR